MPKQFPSIRVIDALLRGPLSSVATSIVWIVIASGVEISQALIPGRFPAGSDLLMNVVGASAGAWLWVVGTRKRAA